MATYYFDQSKRVYRLNYIDPASGKRRRPIVGKSEAEAKKALVDLKYHLQNYHSTGIIEVLAVPYFQNYRINLGRFYSNPMTIKRYGPILDRWIAYLEKWYNGVYLHKIDSILLNRYRDWRLNKVKTETVNLELHAISRGLEYALENHLVAANPVRQIKKSKGNPKPIYYWESEECQKIIDYFYGKQTGEFDYLGDLFTVLMNTGMRRDELRFLLKKKDYLPNIGNNGVIHIRIKKLPDGALWMPKWKIERKIPINKTIYPIIQKYRKIKKESPWLFSRHNGMDVIPKNYLRFQLITALENLNMYSPGYTLHTTRHSFASIAANQPGVDIRAVQDILGHKTIETTMRYLHTSDQRKDYVVAQIPVGKIPNE